MPAGPVSPCQTAGPWEHAGVILQQPQRRLPFIFLMAPPAAGMDTGAVSGEHVVAATVGYGTGTYPRR